MSARSIRRAHEREIERERKTGARSKAAVVAGSALGATVVFAPAAEAATFEVSNLNDSGAGSLRQAVLDANANGADDIITFQAGLTGTITLTDELDVYYDSLDIQGPGANVLTVSGGDVTQIFDLYDMNDANDEVIISGLTLRDGFSIGDGGAVQVYGGLGFAPDLTLRDSILTENDADDDGGALDSFYGALNIVNTQITNNTADDDAGGVYSYYANFDRSEGHGVTISNSVISGNRAEGGEAGGAKLYGSYGDVLVERSTISDNYSYGDGGGITFYGNEYGASTTVDSTTISGNTSADDGGGVGWFGNFDPDNDGAGPAVIQNSTISGNRAASYAGGLYSYNGGDTPSTIRNSTIVDNAAATGGVNGEGGGIYAYLYDNPGAGANTDDLSLSSTIVANNSPNDLGDNDVPEEGDFIADFSLIENPGTARSNTRLTENPAGSNILGVDPALGPLANHGGPTQTHLPTLTSPAVDAGIANGLATDQRGLARTADLSATPNAPGSDATDIGSTEIQAADCQGESVPSQTGTDGDDTLTGTDGPDALFGLGGNDTASGGGGNDCVNGDAGRDRLKGQAGKDLIKGGAGKDRASGGGGKDKLKGQGGKDRLKGGGKADRLNGAGGKDNLKGGGGKDRLKGGKGKDKLRGGGGKDRLNCGGGDNDKAFASEKDKVSANCEKVVTRG